MADQEHAKTNGVWAPALLILGLCLGLTACADHAPTQAPPTGAASPPTATTAGPDPKPLRVWVQAGLAGAMSARAIVKEGDPCPAIVIDGARQAMTPRAAASAAFPVAVCESPVPRAARAAVIAGEPLPLPPATITKVVVIGDTGCRVSNKVIQNCADPKEWPLATVARAVAAEKPQAILHVGDVIYRDAPCPAGNAACAGSPVGDIWASWKVDWFDPAEPLFKAAPIIATRGNHETCERDGRGWNRFLSPGPPVADCRRFDEPAVFSLGPENVVIVDSAEADDYRAIQSKVDVLTAALKQAGASFVSRSWLLTHKPAWAVVDGDGTTVPKSKTVANNVTWQAAFAAAGIPDGLDLVLSGHIHTFQATSFEGGRPAQILVGGSGAELHTVAPDFTPGRDVAGAALARGWGAVRYGYLVLERDDKGWTGRFKSPEGALITTCVLRGRLVTCR